MASISASKASTPPTAQTAAVIGGHHTEITRVKYADSEFWIVTQVGKIGNVVRCAKQIGVTGKETIITETLFGQRDNQMCNLFARVMAERIITSTLKPVTLGFALLTSSTEELKDIVTLATTLLA
jgi:hypothetical protein